MQIDPEQNQCRLDAGKSGSKDKYSAATAQISNLSQETKSLNEKVSLAAQLDATNIRVQTLNKKEDAIRNV